MDEPTAPGAAVRFGTLTYNNDTRKRYTEPQAMAIVPPPRELVTMSWSIHMKETTVTPSCSPSPYYEAITPPFSAYTPGLSNDVDADRLGLVDDRPAETLKGQTGETELRLLDLGDLVDVLEADSADNFLAGVAGALSLLAALVERGLGSVKQKP